MFENGYLLKSLRGLLAVNLLFTAWFSSFQLVQASDGRALFAEKCSGCHTVGGGVLVGPDLAICAERPASDLASSVKAMEKSAGPLADDEVCVLVKYLQGEAVTSGNKKIENISRDSGREPEVSGTDDKTGLPNLGAVSSPKTVTSDAFDAKARREQGRRLFFGEAAFSKGGLSCTACHSSEGANSVADGGSNLGPDLAGIGKKMPYPALVAACEKAPFKIMRTTYAANLLTHEEAQAVAAYLSSLKNDQSPARVSSVSVAAGLLAASVMLSIAFGYRFRNKSARDKLARRR